MDFASSRALFRSFRLARQRWLVHLLLERNGKGVQF
ncbi:hypothetical protein FHS90_003033 [Rufibacter quisquiliarum]|uniref:Uncharacterized protein n=1 Tax=Rufibacter quisquiliarum TaxID=1549639 RepID=A0A839GTW0_9BACT|nr:hypothetical protein [Rufibacter quisquiliarum]